MCPFTHRSQPPDIREKERLYPHLVTKVTPDMAGDNYLSQTDLAVLRVLVESPDRIVGRETIVRRAGLDSVSMRRADASIVVLRRILGADSIVTVRRRGWMLASQFHGRATSLMDSQIEHS